MAKTKRNGRQKKSNTDIILLPEARKPNSQTGEDFIVSLHGLTPDTKYSGHTKSQVLINKLLT